MLSAILTTVLSERWSITPSCEENAMMNRIFYAAMFVVLTISSLPNVASAQFGEYNDQPRGTCGGIAQAGVVIASVLGAFGKARNGYYDPYEQERRAKILGHAAGVGGDALCHGIQQIRVEQNGGYEDPYAEAKAYCKGRPRVRNMNDWTDCVYRWYNAEGPGFKALLETQ